MQLFILARTHDSRKEPRASQVVERMDGIYAPVKIGEVIAVKNGSNVQ